MNKPDSAPNFPSDSAEYLQLLESAMRAEMAAISAINRDSVGWDDVSDEVRRLEVMDGERFGGWSQAFDRGRTVMWHTRSCGGEYWDLNLPMIIIQLDEGLSESERTATEQLVRTILWTRVEEVPTKNTEYPLLPSAETIRKEFQALRRELLGEDLSELEGYGYLPRTGWRDVINALLTGQVKVGEKGSRSNP